MNLSDYQRLAVETSVIDWTTARGRQVAVLGVLGELGSLATVIKKRLRDGGAYAGAINDLAEECGDVLWYIAAIATHYGLELSHAVENCYFKEPVGGVNGHLWSLIETVMVLNSVLAADDEFFEVNPEDLEGTLGETTLMLLHAVKREGLELDQILASNLQKTKGLFWEVTGPAPHRDSTYEPYEQLPRTAVIQFLQRSRGSIPEVLLRMNGHNVGDRLTDNSVDPDGYRFHDALHLGYVAVLGWSPVMRSLLRLKRKSNSAVDEQQDGARAIVIEEAITQQIFNQANDHNLFRGVARLDYNLMKWVQKMVRGLEVDSSSAAEWQRAILQGYGAFRALKENSGGFLAIDAERRELRFTAHQPSDA